MTILCTARRSDTARSGADVAVCENILSGLEVAVCGIADLNWQLFVNQAVN